MLNKILLPAIFLFVVSFISSCNETKKEADKPKEEVVDYDSLNKQAISQLIKLHNAINGWQDSTLFSYTFQNELTGNVISYEGRVKDVIKYGENYILSIESNKKVDCIAHLIIDSSQVKKLESYKKKISQRGCFILMADKIKPILSQHVLTDGHFSGDPQDEGTYDEIEVEVNYEFGRVLEIKGRLLDFYMYKYGL